MLRPMHWIAALLVTGAGTASAQTMPVYYDAVVDGKLQGGKILINLNDPDQRTAFGLDAPAIASLRAWPVTTIVENGPTDNRIDLVLLGDGYTSGELIDYAAHVQNVLIGFLSEEPLAAYATYFNVHRVEITSNESGVDELDLGIYRDTVLDMGYGCAGIDRLLCINLGLANAAAAFAPDVDQILALANSTRYGGAGYQNLGTLSGDNPDAIEIALHEFGHSFAGLADEYDYGDGVIYSGPEPTEPNLSIYNALEQVAEERKWHLWMALPQVSTFEGAQYSEFGIYRPTLNSKMRALNRRFEEVNVEQFVISVYRSVSPIDYATPSDDEIHSASETLFVVPLHPTDHELSIQWSVDGAPIEGATKTDFTPCETPLAPGSHVVSVTVVDNTPRVRDEDARATWMTATRSWEIQADGPCAFYQACCFEFECHNLGEGECYDFGGWPHGPGTSCESMSCPAFEACCFVCNCEITPPPICLRNGGEPQGAGTSCATTDCPNPACCLRDGACLALSCDDCFVQGGWPQSGGGGCSFAGCLPFEACCYPWGYCDDVPPTTCKQQSGTSVGPGTTCASVSCPSQACCLPDGHCEDLEPQVCYEMGGQVRGFETDCATEVCEAMEACCFDQLYCGNYGPPECLSYGGVPQGMETSCQSVDCSGAAEACCLPNGMCIDASQSDCAAGDGRSQGQNTECVSVACAPFRACCFGFGCADLPLADCVTLGGVDMGAQSACETSSCPAQACCLADSSCLELDPDDCVPIGGRPQGMGTECAAGNCPVLEGCCFATGCINLIASECAERGGIEQGSGTICEIDNCPLPEACCFSDGYCATELIALCTMYGGTPQGPESDCANVSCPRQACCFPEGACEDIAAYDCYNRGGRPLGQHTTCETETCIPFEACCFDNFCQDMPPDLCVLYGGLPYGAESDCGQTPCPDHACCRPDGACEVMQPSNCFNESGEPQGPNSTCESALCEPFEACCFAFFCGQYSPRQCDIYGGIPRGAGSDCESVECPEPEACCYPDGYCGMDSPIHCDIVGGHAAGPGTECDSETCDLFACDFNGDGLVGRGDVAIFIQCMAGPGVDVPPVDCDYTNFVRADLDDDGDVDLDDFAPMQSNFGTTLTAD